MSEVRKRSPRCPSAGLKEAIEKVNAFYDKENKHAVAPDVAAQGLTYKNARSGTAKAMIASAIYYKLIKRGSDGKLSVTDDFEKYKFAPKDNVKKNLLNTWLRGPKVFATLLDKYGDNFPSKAGLKYELIEMGFKPEGADDAASIFKKSVDFVKSEDAFISSNQGENADADGEENMNDADEGLNDSPLPNKPLAPDSGKPDKSSEFKAITIFLPKGREAILYVPRPFFEKDRDVIKRQINALLTDDEED